MAKLKAVEKPKLLKLDLGCGRNPREGFEGVDSRDFGQKHVLNLVEPISVGRFNNGLIERTGIMSERFFKSWPWKDNSVEEAHSSHFIEHLNSAGRIHFVNELYRILVPEGKCQLITPHWASNRAYGDLTHQWPPVSEMWFYYLDKTWREQNAPHNDFYRCDFLATWGYSLNPAIVPRNQDYQQHALQFWKEAAQDTICTLTKK